MVSKRQLKQVYPLTERAHIMVSTMIWVGLINPPFEVPLGQKGVPLSVSLDHRFTSLGAATAFILCKREGKQGEMSRRALCPHVLSEMWLCEGLQSLQLLLSCRGREVRQEGSPGIIQHPQLWAISAFSAANDVCPPSSFRNSSASQPSLHCQVATSVLHLSSQRKDWMASDQCLLSFLS